MNIKRGFNRVFVVLTVLWAGYCLVGIPIQTQRDAMDFYIDMKRPCDSIPATSDLQHDQKIRKDCYDFGEKMYQEEVAPWKWKAYYRNNWAYILAALVLVPFAMYWICRGVARVGVWVVRGFRG